MCKGFIICDQARPCRAVKQFTAMFSLVEMLEHRPIFTSGYNCMLHVHTIEEEVQCSALLKVETGEKKKPLKDGEVAPPTRRPRFAKQGSIVEATLTLPQTVCLETFADFPQLGRFTLRDEGKSIAIGKVIELGKA